MEVQLLDKEAQFVWLNLSSLIELLYHPKVARNQ